MKVDISFVEDKIKKRGLLYWTVKTKSSNSSGTSYFPSGGGKDDANAEESIEDLNNCLAQIWEYNDEPVFITLKANAANGRKEGPFILVPDGYEEPEEDEYEAPPAKTRGISGVSQAGAPVLTDAYLQKQGYVPLAQMEFEMAKLRAEIELDRQRAAFEAEKKEYRRKMDEEAAELDAKNAKIDSWANKASRIAETVTSNQIVAGNLLGIGVQAAARVLGVDKSQIQTLGAAIFGDVEATATVDAAPDNAPAQFVETVSVAAPSVSEIDSAAAIAMRMMSNPALTLFQKKQILMYIQNLTKNAQAETNNASDVTSV